MKNHGNLKTESGDCYYIPRDFKRQSKLYKEAVSRGDEETMLMFEEGFTDWVSRGDYEETTIN